MLDQTFFGKGGCIYCNPSWTLWIYVYIYIYSRERVLHCILSVRNVSKAILTLQFGLNKQHLPPMLVGVPARSTSATVARDPMSLECLSTAKLLTKVFFLETKTSFLVYLYHIHIYVSKMFYFKKINDIMTIPLPTISMPATARPRFVTKLSAQSICRPQICWVCWTSHGHNGRHRRFSTCRATHLLWRVGQVHSQGF